MARQPKRTTVVRALEEARHGPQGLLNLRDSLPTEREAVARAESWLRERQVMGIAEVLIITGRGRGSPGGVAVVRDAVQKLLGSLKRRGVVKEFAENGPGSFLVKTASMKKLFEAPARSVDRAVDRAHRNTPVDLRAFAGLSLEQSADLRRLAQLSLTSLGAPAEGAFLQSEMERQFTILARAVPAGPDQERLFSDALKRVLLEYEEG